MSPRGRLALCLSLAAALASFLAPAAAQADFGIDTFSAAFSNEDESPDTLAGSHPYEYTVHIVMNQDAEGRREGTLQDLFIELPPGMVGDPLSLPRCSRADFDLGVTPFCPGNSQVGIVDFELDRGLIGQIGIYNLSPTPGSAASLGFSAANNNALLNASLRTGTDYGVTVTDPALPVAHELQQITTHIWGVPMAKSHDPDRRCVPEDNERPLIEGCESDAEDAAFLSLPTRCKEALGTRLVVHSTEGEEDEAIVSAPGLKGCEAIPFEPQIQARPETAAAESPTGLAVGIHIPQSRDPKQRASAHLKDTVVTLPAGLAVNPSAADGLEACTLAQIDLKGPGPAGCPDAAKVGTVSVSSPLVDHPLPGAVYLAKQGENPFGSLLALYLTVNDPLTGVVVKLAGEVEPDPLTGQLKATFKDNPQLPFEELKLDFFGGPRASLTTPATCGTYTTTTDFTPWTSPEGKDAFPSDSFAVTQGANGGSCPTSEAQMPNKPAFEAGTSTPLAGSYSPLLFRLTRENGSQHFAAVNATMPPGLTGKLAGLTECSDAQIAQAASRSKEGQGAIERANPSCPASSEIGTVTVGAGSGAPIHVQGNAYLAGTYKGAPISFAFITPAIAGPFDLGTVVVRAAAYVDPVTAQITVRSDPIPQILDGIPLDVRSIAVNADRPRFTLNPTSCGPLAIGASAISNLGQSAALSNPFQVAGCRGLDFEPRLSLRLKGGTKRGAFPRLRATYVPRPEGEANLKDLVLRFPRSEFIEQGHFRTICTRVQFAANSCPAASVYGHVKAITPLLDDPLQGPVYLRSSNHNLPDVVFVFKGQIEAQASLRIDSVKGGLRASLEGAPDVPLTKVILDMQGGQKGLLVNSRNVCAKTYRASAELTAHSGKEYEVKPAVKSDCGKRGKKR
jgi:hypothetical protein